MTCSIVEVKGEALNGPSATMARSRSISRRTLLTSRSRSSTTVRRARRKSSSARVEVIKSAEDDPNAEFGFSATWDADGFVLMDGELEPSGLLPAGDSVTVTEELTDEQIAAGWSLADIDCGDADVTVEGNSVTITVVADTTITCTFTNALEEGDARVASSVNEGTLGGNPTVPNTAMDLGSTGTVPAAILALLMLSGLGAAAYAVKAEARRRR